MEIENGARLLPLAFVLALGWGIVSAGSTPAPPTAPTPPAPPEDTSEEPAWLGLFLGDAPDGGVKVVEVVDGGPAAKAGIKEGDLLLLVNERPVTDRRSLREVVRGIRPGEKVTLETLRDGKVAMRIVQAEPRIIRLRIPAVDLDDANAPGAPGEDSYLLSEGGRPGTVSAGAVLAFIPPELRRHLGAPSDAGVLVTKVVPGGRASAAGIKVGDVIVRAGGSPLREPGDLDLRILARAGSGSVPLQVLRESKPLTLSLAAASETRSDGDRAKRLAEIETEIAILKARMEALQREIEQIRKSR